MILKMNLKVIINQIFDWLVEINEISSSQRN